MVYTSTLEELPTNSATPCVLCIALCNSLCSKVPECSEEFVLEHCLRFGKGKGEGQGSKKDVHVAICALVYTSAKLSIKMHNISIKIIILLL